MKSTIQNVRRHGQLVEGVSSVSKSGLILRTHTSSSIH
uniref:Uncharacterized protein n=1 Tax=Arundo donax TaxID=35708 RepID=A0A0A9ATL2_ARUDO